MQFVKLGDVTFHVEDRGSGPPLVFANSLGTEFRLWDKIGGAFPDRRSIRYDMRGHGLSDCPPGPYTMDTLVADIAGILDALGVTASVFVGLSVGGIVAQGLAAQRPDLVRAAILSNTAARLGTHQMWQARIDALATNGLAAVADGILERWFSPGFRATGEFAVWRTMLLRTPDIGYAGVAAALKDADLTSSAPDLRLPVLGIAGSEDAAAPPDLVKATVDLIPGARYALIEGAGHLPCVDAPEEYIKIVQGFLAQL